MSDIIKWLESNNEVKKKLSKIYNDRLNLEELNNLKIEELGKYWSEFRNKTQKIKKSKTENYFIKTRYI